MNANLTRNKLPYIYQVTSGAMLALGAASVSLVMAADSHFELCYFMGMTTTDAATDFSPNNFTIRITDQSTGRQLMNAYVNQRNLVGPSNGTIYQKYGVIFAPLANILFEFNNLVNGANTATLAMVGYKVFDV